MALRCVKCGIKLFTYKNDDRKICPNCGFLIENQSLKSSKNKEVEYVG